MHLAQHSNWTIALLSFGILIIGLTACTVEKQTSIDFPDLADFQVRGQTNQTTIFPIAPSGLQEQNSFHHRLANIPKTVEHIPIITTDMMATENSAYIVDGAYDRIADQIYVSDNLGRVTVVNAQTYAILHRFEAWGYLHLDTMGRRLYVVPDGFPLPPEIEAHITVFDLSRNAGELPILAGTLAGMSISVDLPKGRLFVGEPLTFGESSANMSGVRIHDIETLKLLGQSRQGGRPVYNPIRDELLIVAYLVYVSDASTGEVQTQLPILPKDEESFLWCNGCTWATHAYFIEGAGQLGVLAHPHAVGRHASYPLLAFDAATLEPMSEPILYEDWGPDCNNRLNLHLPVRVGDRVVHHEFSANYIVENALEFIEIGDTSPVARIDGIAPINIDPIVAQVTTIDGLIIDLETLSPIAVTDPLCIFGELPNGRRFGRSMPPWDNGSILQIVEYVKTQVALPEPMPSAGLLGYEVAEIIAPSTLGLADGMDAETFFVRTEYDSGLFRTQDGGDTWVLLDTGIPWDRFDGMSIQLSPDFARDRTLFVAGPNVHHRGLGVWISMDEGDTWHPRWRGLDDLRIASLLISPSFSMMQEEDQSLIAQGVSGQIYRSEDAGISWSFLADAELVGDFDNLATFLRNAPKLGVSGVDTQDETLVRIDLTTGDLLYRNSLDETAKWQVASIESPLFSDGSLQNWTNVVAAPEDPFTVYALTDRTIWRTLDGGLNWLQIEMPELESLSGRSRIRTATLLGDAYAGGTTLLVGTSDGQILRLVP